MKRENKLSFIFVWRLNDWGLYNRRHEAFARELVQREQVETVLHVEHINFKTLIHLIFRWIKEKDHSLRKNYAVHIKKSFSRRPVAADDSHKLFIYSVVLFYAGENKVLNKINDYAKRMQYSKLSNFCNNDQTRTVLLVYPPSPYFPDAIKSIKHDVLIADLVDDNISRAADMKKKMQLIENYKNILPSCQWIFSTSPIFKESYEEYAKQPIDYLPNGVDATKYMKRLQKNNQQITKRKTIGYIGIMNREVNMELLEYIISHNKDIDFILIGSATDERSKDISRLTSAHNNLSYLGPKSYDEVPDLMQKCDVLINIKNDDQTTSGADSIKIYEYLATGKPIVATPMPPANVFKDLIYVAEDKVRFSEFIRLALSENDRELQRKRIEVAMANSWGKRVGVMLDKIATLV